MFSSRIPSEFEANAQSKIREKKRALGVEVLDLVVTNPTEAGFRYDDKEILRALSQVESLTYQPEPKGLSAARLAVSHYYGDHGIDLDPESIILTASTSEAYTYLFKLLGDADAEILVPKPGYPLFDFLSGVESLRPVYYPMVYGEKKGWGIDVEVLEALVSEKTVAILFVHPNNPTGSYLKPHELKVIHHLCRKHDLGFIVDEVFLDYGSKRPEALGSLAGNDGALTFVLSGLSKVAGLPQVKLSWIQVSGPADRREEALKRLEFIADLYLSPSAMVQHAAQSILQRRSSIQNQILARIGENAQILESAFETVPNACVLPREGGWYGVIRIEDGISEERRICQLLEEDDVLIHPGYLYHFRSDGFFVVSLLTPTSVFREGLSRLVSRLMCAKP